jgi:hypothetical protein
MKDAASIAVCFWDYSSTLKIEATHSSETSVDFNGVHGIMPQKIGIFESCYLKNTTSTSGDIQRPSEWKDDHERWKVEEAPSSQCITSALAWRKTAEVLRHSGKIETG